MATISLIVCPGVAEVAGVVELLGVDDGVATQRRPLAVATDRACAARSRV